MYILSKQQNLVGMNWNNTIIEHLRLGQTHMDH